MLGNHSLSGLMKWLAHEEWREPFADVLDLHLGLACEDYEMDFEDIAEVIGDHGAMTLWGCAFEDFLTQSLEPDGRNIVEDYLKRRGWKESAGNRRYIEALRDFLHEPVRGQRDRARPVLSGTGSLARRGADPGQRALGYQEPQALGQDRRSHR